MNAEVPFAELEKGEEVLIGPWEISCVLNFAMGAYARVHQFGFGHCIFGRHVAGMFVENYLKGKYGKYSVLKPGLYTVCSQLG